MSGDGRIRPARGERYEPRPDTAGGALREATLERFSAVGGRIQPRTGCREQDANGRAGYGDAAGANALGV